MSAAAPAASAGPTARWTALGIALVAALAYANAVANLFTMDDGAIIQINPLVHSLSGLWRAFAHPYWPEDWGWGQYRPLVIASFAVQWAVGGGAPWLFHLTSIALHIAVCLLLWRVLATRLPSAGAAAGALWFAVHPVHVEAVASAVGQSEVMSAAFVLAAWLAHRRDRRVAALWFALALGSKESGIVFLGLAAGHDLLLDGGWAALRRRRALYVRYGGVAALYAMFLVTIFSGQTVNRIAATWAGAPTGARWLTMLGVVPVCLRLIVTPFALKTDYGPRVIELLTTATPAVWLGAALLAAAVATIVATWRRAPEIAYGIAWFLIAIAPVSNVFFPSGIVLAERTLYLPSAGAAIVVGWLFARARAAWRRRALALAALVVAALAARTWTRNWIWHDDVALTVSALHDSPASYKAHHAAGVYLAFAGRWADAAVEYRRARQLFPLDGEPYRGGAEAALVAHDYDGAAALLDSARRLAPMQINPWLRLADVRMLQHRWREAGALAFAAYELCPDSVRAIDIVAETAVRSDDLAGAQAALRRGLADHPDNVRLRREYDYTVTLRARARHH